MSRLGNPNDNAKAERFMRTLKQEEVDGSAYRDVADARTQVASFIETYNRQRLHSALDYLSPDEYEDACSGQGRAPVRQTGSVTRPSVSPEGCAAQL
jgi:transposase InsO family protein